MTSVNDLIDTYYSALKAGDHAALAKVLSEDIQVDYYGPPGLFPWQGTWTGLQGFFDFLQIVAENLVIDSVTPLQRIVAETSVVIVLDGQWTIRKTGQVVTASVANIFTVSAGKIGRYQVFTDTAAFGLGLNALRQNAD